MFADSRISGSGLPEELQASIALSRRLKNILLRSVVLMERGFPGAVRTHNRSEFTFRRQFQIEMIDGSKGRAVRAREGLNEPSDNERQRLSHAANSAAAQTQRSRAARAEAGSPDLVR